MGRWGIRSLETMVGRECSISRGGARFHSGGIRVGGVRGGGVTVLWQGGQLQEWELPRALNLDKESCEHLRWTHLEQVQHCTDLPRQVTFPAHTEQGKMGPGLEWTLPLIRRRRRMRRRGRARVGQERRKSENRRPILKMLCAALLRSFRGQHSEKMNGESPG